MTDHVDGSPDWLRSAKPGHYRQHARAGLHHEATIRLDQVSITPHPLIEKELANMGYSYRSHDHATTRIEDNDRERWYVPCHPHITVYTSEDPTYYRLEGHAYITYSDEGIPCGLASRDELGEHHSNPELHVYHKQLPVKFSEMAAEPQLENRMMDICTDIRCHMYSDDPEWPRMHSRSMCRLHRGRSDTASTNSSSNASPNSSPCASPGSSN